MGEVYRAWDEELDEVVALKLLRPERLADKEAQERFRWEVKLARRVTHPNVARIYELGRHEQGRFLTMSFVDGPDLAEVLRIEGPLPFATLASVARDVAAALEAAHAANVVHLDIKPANVLLGPDGTAVVTDFGLAGALGEAAMSSSEGSGTPAYMAPEQVEGATPSPATDLFAFGALLFEAASGTLPWKKPTIYATVMARMLEPPRSLAELQPELPGDAVEVIHRCLQKDPELRPGSAREVAAAFSGSSRPARRASVLRTPPPKPIDVVVAPLEGADSAHRSDLRYDLVEALARYPGLRVHSDAPAETGPPAPEAWVLRPTVSVDHETVTMRLDLPSGGPVQVRAGTALDLHDQAGAEVARRLGVHRRVSARAADLPAQAVEHFLAARRFYRRFEPPACLDALQRALRCAPQHPLLLAAWSLAVLQGAFLGNPDPGPEGLQQALRTAEEVIEVAPHLAEAHVAAGLARLSMGQTAEGAGALRRATTAAPSHGPAQAHVGALLAEAGRAQDGLRRLELALTLDPDMGPARWNVARVYALEGDARLHTVLGEAEARPSEARLFAPYVRLLTWRDDLQPLRQTLELLMSLPDSPDRGAAQLIAQAHLQTLRPQEAYARLAVGASSARRRALGYQLVAELAARLGDVDSAADAIAQAQEDGLADLAWFDACPLLGPVRARPYLLERLRAPLQARSDEVCEAIWGEEAG